MATLTLEQKIAQSEDKTARLKEQARKMENGQKIITGGMMLSLARNNPQRAKTLLEDIKEQVTKKTDLERMQPIIDELTGIVEKANQPKTITEYPV